MGHTLGCNTLNIWTGLQPVSGYTHTQDSLGIWTWLHVFRQGNRSTQRKTHAAMVRRCFIWTRELPRRNLNLHVGSSADIGGTLRSEGSISPQAIQATAIYNDLPVTPGYFIIFQVRCPHSSNTLVQRHLFTPQSVFQTSQESSRRQCGEAVNVATRDASPPL